MKKITIIICILILITGCGKQKESKPKEENKPKIDYKIDTIERQNCENEAIEYYTTSDQTVYLVCLEEVELLDEQKTLKNYLESGKTINEATDKMVSLLTIHASLLDGGTSVYRDTGSIIHTKNGITLIKCNKTDGRKDVYIGPNELNEDWGFENGFCGHNLTQENE